MTIDGTEARDVLATPDGRFVYVANYSASEVSVIDTSTYLVTNIATPAGPRRLAITPGGDRIFATDFLGNSVSVIDTLTQTLIKNIPVGNNPRGIAITPDGREIYVTNVGGSTVSVIDNAQLTVVATIRCWQHTLARDHHAGRRLGLRVQFRVTVRIDHQHRHSCGGQNAYGRSGPFFLRRRSERDQALRFQL